MQDDIYVVKKDYRHGGYGLDFVIVVALGGMMLAAVLTWAQRQTAHDCLTLKGVSTPTTSQQANMQEACGEAGIAIP